MSIWKYFKHVDNGSRLSSPTQSVLPDPEGPLSTSVPTGAIAHANKVTEMLSDRKQLNRGPYLTLTKDQKLVISQRAAEHGTVDGQIHFKFGMGGALPRGSFLSKNG